MASTAGKFETKTTPQRRHATREAVDFPTVIRRKGRAPLAVRVVDVSPLGFHARFEGCKFERGESLRVELPIVGIVPAQVMWGLKGCFGAKFVLPIDAATFLRMLSAIRTVSRSAESPIF